MKIALILGDFSIGTRPLNFFANNINISTRGLTGSELILVQYARQFRARGHEVAIFTLYAARGEEWEGCRLYDLKEKNTVITSDWGAVISINEPDQLRGIVKGPLRICSQQLNGFSYCQPGFDSVVDLWLSPSVPHMKRSMEETPNPSKWRVLRDGCSPEELVEGQKVPGRVIWASSPDRGSHWLLSVWSQIKEAVPHASLRMFYHLTPGNTEGMEQKTHPGWNKEIYELGQRYRYIREAVEKLKPLGVELVGSVSRDQIVKEFNQAEVLGFSVETVVWSEGFSIATLEGCCYKACPIITDCDALGEIYGGIVPMVPCPLSSSINQYRDLVIQALKDNDWRNEVNEKCRAFALRHDWKDIVAELEGMILQHPLYRKA